jgi:hypothetical protein
MRMIRYPRGVMRADIAIGTLSAVYSLLFLISLSLSLSHLTFLSLLLSLTLFSPLSSLLWFCDEDDPLSEGGDASRHSSRNETKYHDGLLTHHKTPGALTQHKSTHTHAHTHTHTHTHTHKQTLTRGGVRAITTRKQVTLIHLHLS